MKKITTLFALVFCASMAFAQTATVNQTNLSPAGSTLDAAISQTGNHLIKIDQLSDKINTSGNPNVFTATVSQKKAANGGNQVYLKQTATGTGNGAAVLSITTEQNGDNNIAWQTQQSINYAAVDQTFVASQKGKGNKLTQFSNNGGFMFTATQDGMANIGKQEALAGAGKNNVATLYQKGESNQGYQKFAGKNARVANIEQVGDRNYASQSFDGGAYGAGAKSSADVIQKGDDDIAVQTQNGIGSYQYAYQDGSGFNRIDQVSVGDYNDAYAKQTGSNGKIRMEQTSTAAVDGEGNMARVSQAGDGSEAIIYQTGCKNVVEGLSAGTSAINNNGSYLKVVQNGSDNLVQSMQTAVGASETVTQTGMNNTAIVSQN